VPSVNNADIQFPQVGFGGFGQFFGL
jgi:hypothetical protein